MLFRQMEYFQAVVEKHSFSEAAELCHVSQSAISQQIARLEEELGIQLLERHNRTFKVTPAGAHFYRKSLVLRSDAEQLIRETKKIAAKEAATLRLGYYMGYHGAEFAEAVAEFSDKYPAVQVTVMSGSHEDIYHALQGETIDLGLNDQRRAFSGAYNNVVLSESSCQIEIAARNPLSALDSIEVSDLKNIPCILVAGADQQEEEQSYYDEIIGLHGQFLFADSLQDARLKIITGQGYLPVDVIGEETWFDTAVCRIPLTRNGESVRKTYCMFWKKDNSGYYVEEFAEMLQNKF